MASSYNKNKIQEEMAQLETKERKLLAERRPLTPEELAVLHRLEFLRGLWACRFSNR